MFCVYHQVRSSSPRAREALSLMPQMPLRFPPPRMEGRRAVGQADFTASGAERPPHRPPPLRFRDRLSRQSPVTGQAPDVPPDRARTPHGGGPPNPSPDPHETGLRRAAPPVPPRSTAVPLRPGRPDRPPCEIFLSSGLPCRHDIRYLGIDTRSEDRATVPRAGTRWRSSFLPARRRGQDVLPGVGGAPSRPEYGGAEPPSRCGSRPPPGERKRTTRATPTPGTPLMEGGPPAPEKNRAKRVPPAWSGPRSRP